MIIALIVIGIMVAVAVTIEIVGRIVSKKEDSRFENMSPEERRKYQERMYRAHHFSDSTMV